jgi:two-component system, sensor histidine kinase and response regulator
MDAEHTTQNPGLLPTATRFGLRLKFVVLFSVILIVTCSSLSWYFIETRRRAMTDALQELGTILLTNTVQNDHFRIGGIVLEDRETLAQFTHSLMTIDRVVYLVITGSDGHVLNQQSKRTSRLPVGSPETSQKPIYPDDGLPESLLRAPTTAPLITRFILSSQERLVPQNESSDWLLPFLLRPETLFDFAMPVIRERGHSSQFWDELGEKNHSSPSRANSSVVGTVRIGITTAQAKQALLIVIRNMALLTLLMIATGILSAHLLTSRITTPLRSLVMAARQLADGQEAPGSLAASTSDEVGQLTRAFNVMTHSLHERNQAISLNLDTIRRQVRQLTTVHQASVTIANTVQSDMNYLLDTVLKLIVENLGFAKMMVVLRHPERNSASIARIIGVLPEIEEAVRGLEVPIAYNGGLTAELLLDGKPVLVPSVEAASHRFYPPLLELVRRSKIQSFVAAPLQSHGKILGYLAGDRGLLPCREDDLNILLTIAGHVAAAVDNAKAYADLAELTQYLEARIAQRTEELSFANARLQEHDRRRSTFLSVVSHELRTPMTAIRSFADNMLDGVTGPLTELQQTYLTRIQHNVGRLSRIIAQLLDWSGLETKRLELRLEEVCIRQIAAVAADSLRMVAAEKNVSLAIAEQGSLPSVQGDQDKLEQVLWNLLGNAIKFTSPGGHVAVEFRVSPPGFVQTCVSDNGCGIDPAHISNVFEEFSRAPSSMPASQGAQLGLCITKRLVTMHHGRIWVKSRPQAGSQFYFTLPISAPQDEATRTVSESREHRLSS